MARAWTDAAFRDRLLADGSAAAAELGFQALGTGGYRLRVVANTAALHSMIVCTLCSCYPVPLLGPPPGWYKSLAYRSHLVREPRAVLAEFGFAAQPSGGAAAWRGGRLHRSGRPQRRGSNPYAQPGVTKCHYVVP